MDDKLSTKSSDSVTTSGEYEMVPEELDMQSTPLGTSPTLKIANNGNFNDLEKSLNEVIHELDDTATNNTIEMPHTGQSQVQSGKCRLITSFSFMRSAVHPFNYTLLVKSFWNIWNHQNNTNENESKFDQCLWIGIKQTNIHSN